MDDKTMSKKDLSSWLKWAVQLEDEADCDIEAGVNANIDNVSVDVESEQLIAELKEAFGSSLSDQELKKIADVAEKHIQKQVIKERLLCAFS